MHWKGNKKSSWNLMAYSNGRELMIMSNVIASITKVRIWIIQIFVLKAYAYAKSLEWIR